MRSDIFTSTAMGNDADATLQEAIQILWRAAVAAHKDRFVVSSVNHAATLVTSTELIPPSFARRVTGATAAMHSTEQILITAVLVVEVLG